MWRIGSLFSGVGGLELGLHAAGVGTTAWLAECDKDASAVLEARFPGVANLGDVTRIDWSVVEPVDVLVGGYPCQPFSIAGQRGGGGDARHLWPHFARALRLLRPRYAVLENVAGHLSLGFDAVLADLAEAGFDAEWTTLRASDVGAPHRRERLFVIASDSGVQPDRPDAGGAPGGEACDGPGGPDGPWSGAGAPADADGIRTGEPDDETDALTDEWAAWLLPGGGGGRVGAPPADAEGPGRPGQVCEQDWATSLAGGRLGMGWGNYAAAVARWEHALGRAAPPPVDDRGRLNAEFSEWMMGFPAGWVTGVLARNPSLRCIGNAVVPQCAEVVGRWLLDREPSRE